MVAGICAYNFAPEAEGVGFVGDEVKAAANSSPFVLEDGPGGVGGGGELFGGWLGVPGPQGRGMEFRFSRG